MKERLWMPEWVKQYRRDWLSGDLSAGLIVSVMLIPQSLAYALLAGLPPQVGLYASVLPLVAYALLGSSMTLAVGPVAIISLMTASALTPLAVAGSDEYVVLAMMLALMSGVLLFSDQAFDYESIDLEPIHTLCIDLAPFDPLGMSLRVDLDRTFLTILRDVDGARDPAAFQAAYTRRFQLQQPWHEERVELPGAGWS